MATIYVTIKNLTIDGSNVTNPFGVDGFTFSGILVNNANVILLDNAIKNFLSSQGIDAAAVVINNSHAQLKGNSFTNNSIAVAVNDGSKTTGAKNVFTYNAVRVTITENATVDLGLSNVYTDKDDYAPGSIVTFSGDNGSNAGYIPGEAVHVDVSGPNGYVGACAAVVNGMGAWSCQIILWSDARAKGDYSFTATSASGIFYSGKFSDSNSTISGTVRDSVTNNRLNGVTVECTAGCIQTDTVTSGSGANAGEYSLPVTFTGYSHNITLTFSLNGYQTSTLDLRAYIDSPASNQDINLVPINKSLTINATAKSKTYGDNDPALTYTYTTSDGSTPSFSGNLSRDAGTSVGNYTIRQNTLTAAGYAITYNSAQLTINAKPLQITAKDRSKTYGRAISLTSSDFTTNGLIKGNAVNSVTLASDGIGAVAAAGIYDIIPSVAAGTGLSNYTITYAKGTLTVNKVNPSCIINGYKVTYDNVSHTAAGSCKGVDGLVLTGLNLSNTAHINGGTYSSDNWLFTDVTGNYNNISGVVSDQINPAVATITFSAASSPTYLGGPFSVSATSSLSNLKV